MNSYLFTLPHEAELVNNYLRREEPMYERYAKLRDERGLTDYAVAKATGILTATLTSWKQGVYQPKVDKLMKIADFLGVDINYFLKEDGK